MKINHQLEKQKYIDSLYRVLTELAEKAWLHGIEITEVSLKDNFIQEVDMNKFGYGDKYILPAPKIKSFETPYGEIKIK